MRDERYGTREAVELLASHAPGRRACSPLFSRTLTLGMHLDVVLVARVAGPESVLAELHVHEPLVLVQLVLRVSRSPSRLLLVFASFHCHEPLVLVQLVLPHQRA